MTGISLLVDGNNILARAEFAHQSSRQHMSVDGVETGPLVLFTNMLSRYVRMVGATHVGVYWDGGYQFRTDIYPGYKEARREKKSNVMTSSMGLVTEWLDALGIFNVRVNGLEADDLIAMATRTPSVAGHVILSGDKDLLQLVGERDGIGVLQLRPPSTDIWGPDEVNAEFGVYPQKLAHYLALVGDTVDSVPGLRGVGPKKALKMMAEADWDWDTLLEGLDAERRDTAETMLRLVDLRDGQYPDPIIAAPVEIPEVSAESETFCKRWELNSIYASLMNGTLWRDPPSTPDPAVEWDSVT